MPGMRVAIAGAGPAGASLAWLFARRGIGVVLIERQTDFAREFRGEGLMPGGVDALRQMGLEAELDRLPQSRIHRLEVYLNGRRELALDVASLPRETPLPRFVSQPALLEMLVAPGVLLLGDAAHPMSPVGAQGINIGLRDALVAANQLGPLLLRGSPPAELDAAAARVAAERLPEVKAIQRLQAGPPRLLLQQTPLARVAMRTLVPLAMRTGVFGLAFRRILPHFAFGTTEVELRF